MSLSPQPNYRQGLGLLSGPGWTHKSKQPWGDGGPSQSSTGTHVHVVDAVATYCSPVVTEVILNSWVPHLKCGREERRSPSRNRWRGGIGSPDTRVRKYSTSFLCHSRTGGTIKNKDLSLQCSEICPILTVGCISGKACLPSKKKIFVWVLCAHLTDSKFPQVSHPHRLLWAHRMQIRTTL